MHSSTNVMTGDRMERKALSRLEAKASPRGEVEAIFATFGVVDHDGDWTLPTAFEDGAPVRISAYGHASWTGALPVGKGTIRVTAKDARLVGQFFLSTTAGRETFTVIRELGELGEWSYGFDVLETGDLTEELKRLGARRVLKKVKVYEVSPVLAGAGVGTRTVTAKASLSPALRSELERLRAENDRRRQRLVYDLRHREIPPSWVPPVAREAAEWGAEEAARCLGFKTPRLRWFTADAEPRETKGFALVGNYREVWLRATADPDAALEVAAHETAHALGVDSDQKADQLAKSVRASRYRRPQPLRVIYA